MIQSIHSSCSILRNLSVAVLLAIGILCSNAALAQTYDLTMQVLVNSNNPVGYNTSTASPGEYQRSLERYLEHLQIPYRVIDTATQTPPTNLSSAQLIVAGHTGLSLSSAWQQAILQAVQGGTGFVNFDADPAIGTYTHIQAIFGASGSVIGPSATLIDVPAAVMPDGATPHYIAAMQIRFSDTPAGDFIYNFHKDANNVQQVARPTLLTGANGTTIATVGNSPLIIATQTAGGRAVDFTTYDFMRPDRFGFMMGIDDLIWRSLVWSARKPFVLRGYPRFYAPQMDDQVVGWGQRLRDMWDPALTGPVASNGTGGPWKVTAMAQMVNLEPGGQDRTDAIADVNAGNLKIAIHTNTGISQGDFYWNPQSPNPLTDAQWQSNLAYAQQILQGQGGADTLPALSKSMVPHFWNLSNNTGYDLWNSLNVRYITEIQQPGAYYAYGPPKLPSMRLWTRPFRVFEIPPTGVNPNELYTLYSADFMSVGSTAGLPPARFFTFTTQLLGNRYPSFDARWPNDSQAVSVEESVNNFAEYTWRFWSGMAPVQMYNHDGGSFEVSTEAERQQAVTQISSFLNSRGVRHVFMEDLGAYMCARVTSVLTSAQASPSTLTLNFTGNATDMDNNPVPTNFYVFNGDDEGVQGTVPGFTGGYSFNTPNVAPPRIGLGTPSLTFSSLPGAAPVSQSVTIDNTGSGTLSYSVQTSAPWLTASGAGTAPNTILVTADPGQLAAGVYTGVVQINAPGAINAPQSISVTFAVQGPTLVVSGNTLTFAGFQGSANPAAQQIAISNLGAGTMNWTASSSQPWLQLESDSGSIVSGNPVTLGISADLSGLAPGSYSGAVTINSPNAISGSPQVVNVTLTVTGILMKAVFLGPTLDGWAYSPVGSPAGWTVGSGVLAYSGAGATQLFAGNSTWSNYTVQASFRLNSLLDYPGGLRGYINPTTGASYALWLYPNEGVIKLWRTPGWSISSSPVLLGTSGHLDMDNVSWHTIALSMNGGRLIASYDGVGRITANDSTLSGGMVALDVSNRPIQFQSVFVTGNQIVQTQLLPSPAGITFNAVAGSTTPAQTLQLSTNDGAAVASTAVSPSLWLGTSPVTGSGASRNVTIQANASQLAPGTYATQVLVSIYGVVSNPVSIPITLNVTPASTNQLTVSPTSLQFNAAVGSGVPAAQTLSVTSTTAGLGYTASSDSAWLMPALSGVTPGTISVSLNQSGLAAGTYTGHITISAPAAMNPTTTVNVTLNVSSTPPVTLMQTSFPGTTLDGWSYSPKGLAANWSLSNNVLSYNGGGATQLYAGNSTWSNYTAQVSFLLSSLNNYPGGIRAYLNPANGASYAAWIYPADGVVKIWRATTWNIDSNPVLLGTSARVSIDAVNWHTLGLSISGGQLVALYDGTPVVRVADSTLSGGMVALDVSNKPIKFASFSVTGSQGITSQITTPQSSLNFIVPAGSLSTAQSLQVATTDGSVAAWSALPQASWISVSGSSGKTPGSASVQIDATNLATGTYNGAVNIASFGATNNSILVPISVSVTAPSTNQVTASPSTLSFTAVAGGASPAPQALAISSTTAGLSAGISSDSSWLTSTASGVTPFSAQITVDPSSLLAGSYTGHLTITAPGAMNPASTVTVTLSVSAPALAASPSQLSFVGSNSSNAPSQKLLFSNAGGGAVGWTASFTSPWLNLDTTSSITPSTVQVGANSTGMAVGTYNDLLTATPSTSSGTGLQVPVTLRVGGLLFSDDFSSNSQWTASPMGLASNWSIAGNSYSYNGGGATQQYAGSAGWTNYTLQADMKLTSTGNYPGGVRFRLSPATGAGYAVWLYPATGQVKLLRAPAWNINTNSTTLATSAKANLAVGVHHLRIDAQGSQLTVYVDNAQVISVTDASYGTGAVALDVSNQPVAFSNVTVISF